MTTYKQECTSQSNQNPHGFFTDNIEQLINKASIKFSRPGVESEIEEARRNLQARLKMAEKLNLSTDFYEACEQDIDNKADIEPSFLYAFFGKLTEAFCDKWKTDNTERLNQTFETMNISKAYNDKNIELLTDILIEAQVKPMYRAYWTILNLYGAIGDCESLTNQAAERDYPAVQKNAALLCEEDDVEDDYLEEQFQGISF